MAVAMGRIALISPTKEKIAAVRDIKKYAENAVALNPSHAGAWHVLGVWNWEVSNLNAIERNVADWFFGGLPAASKDKAVEFFLKAVSLNSTDVLYQHDLGMLYKEKGEKEKAKTALEKCIKMTAQSPDDPGLIAEAKEKLKDLN
jgi:tetratricopeptide (TPR) repeat protein